MRLVSGSQKKREEHIISKLRQLYGILASKHDVGRLDSMSGSGVGVGAYTDGNRILRINFMGAVIYAVFMPCGWVYDIIAADAVEKGRVGKDCKDRKSTIMTVGNSTPVYSEFGFWTKMFSDLKFCMDMTPALAESYARYMSMSGMPVMRKHGTDSPNACTGTKKAMIHVAGRCCRCGSPENLTYDHIVPRWMGGMTNMANGQVLCDGCNQDKRGTFADYRINIWPQSNKFVDLFIRRLWQGN